MEDDIIRLLALVGAGFIAFTIGVVFGIFVADITDRIRR